MRMRIQEEDAALRAKMAGASTVAETLAQENQEFRQHLELRTSQLEQALPVAELLARTVGGRIDLISVKAGRTEVNGEPAESRSATEVYLNRLAETLRQRGVKADITMRSGNIPEEIGRHGIESNSIASILN